MTKEEYCELCKSKTRSQIKFNKKLLIKHHPEIYELIKTFSEENGLSDLMFQQQAYHFVYNIREVPKCPECNEHRKFVTFCCGYQEFCSAKCANKSPTKITKTKNTLIERYGTGNINEIESVKEKRAKTNIEKYGVDNPFKLKNVQDKIKEDNIKKYGFSNPNKNKEFREKYKETCRKKYGADCHLFLPDIREKIKKTTLEVRGVENVFDLPEVQAKIRKKCLDDYGHENYFKTEHFKKNHKHKLKVSSKIELDVCMQIGFDSNITINGYRFDCVKDNLIIEVDGDYFHCDNLENLSILQINAAINDVLKLEVIKNTKYKLIRVKVSGIKKIGVENITVDKLFEIQYHPNKILSVDDVVLTKEYLVRYLRKYKDKKLARYVPMLLKFVRLFNPESVVNFSDEELKKRITNIIGLNTNREPSDFSIRTLINQ